MGSMLSDYSQLKSLPAIVGIVFTIASLYQFGGITAVHLEWVDYSLTTQHAMLVSLGAFVVAFASSATRDWAHYRKEEQVTIAMGPILLFGHQYVEFVGDLIATEGHFGPILAFLISMVSFAVAVR